MWRQLSKKIMRAQGPRKHLKLGGAQHFEGTFFFRKRGHFLKIKWAFLCLLQNLGARAPSAPGSYVYVRAGEAVTSDPSVGQR